MGVTSELTELETDDEAEMPGGATISKIGSFEVERRASREGRALGADGLPRDPERPREMKLMSRSRLRALFGPCCALDVLALVPAGGVYAEGAGRDVMESSDHREASCGSSSSTLGAEREGALCVPVVTARGRGARTPVLLDSDGSDGRGGMRVAVDADGGVDVY